MGGGRPNWCHGWVDRPFDGNFQDNETWLGGNSLISLGTHPSQRAGVAFDVDLTTPVFHSDSGLELLYIPRKKDGLTYPQCSIEYWLADSTKRGPSCQKVCKLGSKRSCNIRSW